MRMMGVYDSVLWFSWLITYAVMFLITACLIAAVTSTNVYEFSDKGYENTGTFLRLHVTHFACVHV